MGFKSRLKSELLDLLFPKRCFGCKKEGDLLCLLCRSFLDFIPPCCFVCGRLVPTKKRVTAGRTCKNCQKKSHIYAFLSPFKYDGAMRELIHGLKYRRILELDALLAELIAEYLIKYRIKLPSDAVFIPIPMYPAKKRTRGFNQAELIAERLCDKLSLKADSSLLVKTRPTKAQIELSGEERKNNVKGVFNVARPELVKNKTVILVDDVKTTGATLEEAARVLKEAEAKRVWAITVAR